MHTVKTVKIIFYFTALLLLAKPFLGFSLISRTNLPVQTNLPAQSNILIKLFSKRKQEFNEGSENNIQVIQQKLANPVANLVLLFSFFLALLFPAFFNKDGEVTNGFLSGLQLRLIPVRQTYLRTGKLLI